MISGIPKFRILGPNEQCREETYLPGSDQFLHEPGYTVTVKARNIFTGQGSNQFLFFFAVIFLLL